MDMIQKFLNLNDLERNFMGAGAFLSAFPSQKNEKTDTTHRINVTVSKIKFVAGQYRDISPKHLYYKAQNLMCRSR